MSSFHHINYSLRPSKSIQRQIIFDGIRTLRSRLDISESIYIGFGSIWFADFVMAHKILDIEEMISMEEDEILYRRAVFNSPYASVKIRQGSSSDILPTLYEDETICKRPWVMWLDYDSAFDETSIDDTRAAIERVPGDTIFLVTFNGRESKYGKPKNRPGRLRDLFGDVVPDDLCVSRCDSENMGDTLADLATDFMKSSAARAARPGGFVPTFRMIYRDGAVMVTVGGILPSSRDTARAVSDIVETDEWKCRPERPIISPLLTIREAMALQSKLPSPEGLSRKIVQALGFDLEDEQIEAYERYYREYPAFAQIIT